MSTEVEALSAGAPLDWDAVGAYLATRGMRLDAVPAPRQFAGGLANRNYLIHIDGAPAVLRRPPDGDLPAGSHDMAREHRILSRLSTALPFVPRGMVLCEDRGVIGVPFQIIEYRAGRTVRATLPDDLKDRPGVGERLTEVVLGTLAALHAVDPAAVGLDDLGKPAGFLGRAVAGWRKRGAAVAYEDCATLLAELGAWLEREQVPDGAPALLHNDFKLDNMILSPADLSAVAVVDWDQGTRGDPLFDLGTLMSYWAQPDDPPAMRDLGQMPTTAPGFPDRAAAVSRYAALTGRDVSAFRFHRVLGMYKTSIIFLQLGHRFRTGETDDPRYADLSARGVGLLAFTHEIAQGRAF
jgi:aminoglycoside phosphotransferase (APT) family kinase protein